MQRPCIRSGPMANLVAIVIIAAKQGVIPARYSTKTGGYVAAITVFIGAISIAVASPPSRRRLSITIAANGYWHPPWPPMIGLVRLCRSNISISRPSPSVQTLSMTPIGTYVIAMKMSRNRSMERAILPSKLCRLRYTITQVPGNRRREIDALSSLGYQSDTVATFGCRVAWFAAERYTD